MGKLLTVLRVPELRAKIATTLLLLFVYRLGFQIPLPGIDLSAVAEAANKADENALFGIMNAFTGAGMGQAVLFSLGVMPYLSASIIFSLLTKVVPSLEALSKEGAAGQKKINQLTRLATVPTPLALPASARCAQAIPTPGTPPPIAGVQVKTRPPRKGQSRQTGRRPAASHLSHPYRGV